MRESRACLNVDAYWNNIEERQAGRLICIKVVVSDGTRKVFKKICKKGNSQACIFSIKE
jgi:hypothetical protein